MTSRPGPGIQESLQHRGSGGSSRPQGRRPSVKPGNAPQHVPQDCIDPTLEDQRRAAGDTATKGRGAGNAKAKLGTLEAIDTSSNEAVRPLPKGRPPLFFSNVSSSTPDLSLQSPQGLAGGMAVNLPVPPRPGIARPGENLQQPRIYPGGTGVKDKVTAKGPVTEMPAPAVVFAGGRTADLFPWTGSQPEDTLSEALVKGGISNKPQIMNETNTARPSLWSNLKNKSGLSTLSTLFVAVLEKRQSCGRLSGPNSFKPPPRLTLRDSTRETWLHDLANPTVGIKRLSRTIPHGITGKPLLDQCLNKNIPLPRAVWLAKCVGINEMRSHQRKGQAGTLTWLRGWTSSVEQFLDSTVGTMGQHDWKPRITYALQLATSLYKDHLLEEEHFLDWVLKGLESCVPERLFLWLLIASLYGPDLAACRRRGKRLAESLLNHAEKIYEAEDEGKTSSLLQYLEKIILKLLTTSPTCMLLPRTWDRHWPVLRRLASRHPEANITNVVEGLDLRTRRLLHASQKPSSTAQDCSRGLLRLLDSTDLNKTVRSEQLALHCMDISPSARIIVAAALQWASSPYRDGCYRIYLVTRLIRKWSLLGVDTDDAILAYFHATERDAGSDQRNAFRIVAELIRSQTFSVGKYLQWLIATGSIGRSQDITLQTSWPLRLVTEIPLTGLPPQVRNLRSTLLRSTNYSTEQEEQTLDEAESVVRRTLPILFDDPNIEYERNEVNIPKLSPSIRFELAMILRKQVAANMQLVEHAPTKDPSVEEPAVVCTISAQEFHTVRTYLEGFGDYAILADIIGVVATSLDSHVLAAAADTLNYHRLAFRCIGAFEPLFAKVAMRYAAIRTVRFPERELLVSLSDLCRNVLAEGDLVQALAYDLGRHDQKNVAAACSPVSDTMADTFHNMAVDSEEEIDRILSSGTSMDHQIMTRVFGKIVVSLKEQVAKSIVPSGNHAAWFYRLRSFDESCFDGIVIDWTTSLLMKGQSRMMHAAIPPLVVSGCLTLWQFQDITRRAINKSRATSQEDSLRICMHGLDVLLPTDSLTPLCQPQEAYRYRLEQQNFCQGSDGRILQLLRDLFDSITDALSPSSQSSIKGLLSSERLRAVVKRHISLNGETLSSVFGIGTQSFSAASSTQLKTLLDSLLDPTNRLSQKSVADQVKIIVESASCLSLPFCQLQIRQLFAMSSVAADTSVDTVSGSLVEAIRSAIERDDSPWNELVAGLDTGLRTKIRENAERELLQASAFFSGPATSRSKTTGIDDEAFLRKHLTVINLTSSGTLTDLEAPIFATLVERLKGIADTLNNNQRRSGQIMSGPDSSLRSWLNALLRLTLIHGSMLLHKAPNQHQAAILWSLRLLFTHPVLDNHPVILEYIFDIAVFLSDSISDDVRNHLIKMNTAKPTDEPRCAFLFGTPSTFDGWLALAKPLAPTSSAQSTATAQQPVQQNNNAPGQQPPFYNQQLQSPGSAALQRSSSQQHQQQQMHAQNQNRMYPQYPQHPQQNKTLSHFQRMASNSNGNHSQLQQMQQMQQLQGLAQQRSAQSSPLQMQRQPGQPSQAGNTQAGRPGAARQDKPEIKTLPYALKRWEILPESGGNPAGNETAISLSLFGARRA
ncbi:hypothetical protein K491DRAFT_717612 [Lophiostoma macrostomum CBS 122681]|uniref:Mediator of RNA polymerase II transcription subunit 12 n=1 Tax=Lophiostoma macrostomum CBS 122681 TaxID=1314788 RepID=A0A6A6T1U2_9PLEO|nr:hypothetical protein K491DRAFT_717612 [Lophiostoma macrostomum CBS 122681]